MTKILLIIDKTYTYSISLKIDNNVYLYLFSKTPQTNPDTSIQHLKTLLSVHY